MVQYPGPDVKSVSRFDQFLCQGLSHITGKKISADSISGNRDLISCISNQLARETGIDSCDIAQWISRSLKQYWVEVELPDDSLF
jgi:hypothetical protein